jgi:uncharacterized protein YecE (DUF72 family)
MDKRLRAGTSSWSHASWQGTVYAPDAAPGDYLRQYAARFDTVEIDATWYRIPSEAMVKRWARETPDGFVFAAKVPSLITHEEKLAEAGPAMREFLRVMELLGEKLGPLLLQFPYAFKPDQFEVLDRFLGGLPPERKFAVEIRHKGWLTEKFYDLLRRHRAALALVDLVWMPRLDVLTTDWTYVRFVGDRKGIEKTTTTWEKLVVDRTKETAWWAPRLQAFLDQGIPVWAYFNNHYAGHAPGSVEILKKAMGL